MEKYSEAVKDAQEKLELAEKKATDVSLGLGREGGGLHTGRGPGRGKEGRRDLYIPAPGQKCFPSGTRARASLHK